MKARHAKKLLRDFLAAFPTVVPSGSLLLLKTDSPPETETFRRFQEGLARHGCKIVIALVGRDVGTEVDVGDPGAV